MTPQNNNTPQVSVIIVNWNTCGILKNCLKSLYAETAPGLIEVIVIDNASTDDSCQMVQSCFPDVKLIKNTENTGFAKANNQGIASAAGRYILLLNSDTVILDSVIAQTVSFADDNPDVAVVGCCVLNPDMTFQPSCFMFPSILNMFLSSLYLYKLFPRSRFFAREQMTWWDGNDIRQVDVVNGCFMFVRHQAIEQVGVLDEGFFMYAEETDWCYRFKQAGWKIMFAPVGQIIHMAGQSSRKVQYEMLIQLRVSILKFFAKHHSQLKYKLACLLTALFFTLRLPGWLVITLFGSSRKKQASIRLRAYLSGMKKTLFNTVDLPAEKRSA
jgi:GT2 family glycosyltransferase